MWKNIVLQIAIASALTTAAYAFQKLVIDQWAEEKKAERELRFAQAKKKKPASKRKPRGTRRDLRAVP
jgi:hypothetical protein